jgi:mannose-6-phosphate isomerase-like protein (cupin superfamily)
MKLKAKWVKITDVEPILPIAHINTDTWGLITKDTCGVENIRLSISEIKPGGCAESFVHEGFQQLTFILSGRGKISVNNEDFFVEPDGCLFIPDTTEHKTEVIGKETLRQIIILVKVPEEQKTNQK